MRLIDADAFIEENAEIIDCEINHPKYQDTIRELIDEAPTVEARPHGEWIKSDNKYKGEWKCSVCEKYASFYNNPYKDKSDFCPNCGFPMNEEALEILRKREGDEK